MKLGALIRSLFWPTSPNPDVVGMVKITEREIAETRPLKAIARAEKIVNARKWMLENGHDAVKPIINSRLKGIAK